MRKKIDALIAEHVLGWTMEEFGNGRMCWKDHDHNTLYRIDRDQLPHFSSDISSAWLVVEKMAEKRIHFTICPSKGIARITTVDWVDYNISPMLQPMLDVVSAKDAPKAICLAALKALGVKYE